jgi:hypothetical protein
LYFLLFLFSFPFCILSCLVLSSYHVFFSCFLFYFLFRLHTTRAVYGEIDEEINAIIAISARASGGLRL